MSRIVFRGAVSRGAARGTALGGALLVAAAYVAIGLGGTAQATMTTSAVTTVAAPAAPAVGCEPELNKYDRTRFCFRVGMMVSVLRGRTAVGTVTFDLTHNFQLSTRSRDFTERITISNVRVTGSGTGVRLGLRVSCASPCVATGKFPQGRVIKPGISGVIDYRDGVKDAAADTATSRYALSFTRPGDKPGGYSYQAPISYRCDDELPGLPAGCVFPAYVPYFTAMKGLKGVIGNITAAQGGPAHEGRPGSGHPLHRVASAIVQVANYKAACALPLVGRPPKPGLACDEYPFRSTREGGTATTRANRHVAWVAAAVEAAKNRALVAFYDDNRVLAGDPFWVVP